MRINVSIRNLNNYFSSFVLQFNILTNNSIGYNYFQHLPVESMSFCIYVYNYTNVDKFYADVDSEEEEEDQLEVEYLGPYCFR